ncbi:MAG: nuclear transport factor 2 family protein [Actinomycetia bacterium]|nr:nuclear transport factor 2 family protein [Actinomycetes bacterium]
MSDSQELSVADRVEIHELPGRYGDAIDDRNWDLLDRVFTQDAVFDLTGVGSRVCDGLNDIKSFMEAEAAHMMTNIYADADGDGAQMRSRIVALLGKGRTGTASYRQRPLSCGWGVTALGHGARLQALTGIARRSSK